MRQLLVRFLNNSVLATMLLVIILVAGIAAAFMMVREEMPNVASDQIHISVAYPGADPEEVEEGISRKIEEAVKGMEGVNHCNTVSMENQSATVIEIVEGYDGRELLDRVRTRINEIATFPLGSEKPVITLPLHSDPVMALYVNGAVSEKALKEWSYRVKDQLLDLEQVSQVTLLGIRDYEINVEIPEQNLREYGLTFAQVSAAIRRSNLNRSGGLIRGETDDIRVRTMGRKYTGEALSSVVILADAEGDLVTLDRLATVNDDFSEDGITTTVNGQPAVILSIFKTREEDTIKIADAVNAFVEDIRTTVPPGAEIGILFDNSDAIRQQVDILLKNGIMGLFIVFVLLWLFLNARLSLWTGVGILVSVLGGVAVIWIGGGTINMISIFGFILILGIVADDAIVVGESIAWHRSQGKDPVTSAIDGLREVGLPVMTAVLTTILAFIPLLFIEGIMGKFIRILPVVVIACLLISLFESFTLLPTHLAHQPSDAPRDGVRGSLFKGLNAVPTVVGRALDRFSDAIYAPLLSALMTWRYAFLCLTISLLLVSLGIIRGNFLKFEMLPERDGFYMTAIVEFPEGTSRNVTAAAVRKIEQAMADIAAQTATASGDPLVRSRLAISGQAPGLEPGSFGQLGSHLGGVQVILLDSRRRGIQTRELLKQWQRQVGTISGATSVSYSGTIMGHPGKPIEIAIDGQDPERLAQAAGDLRQHLKQFQGVFDIQADNTAGKDEIQFRLKPEARSLGLTVQDLADQLQTGYYGEEILRVQRGRDDVRIRIRYTRSERQRQGSLDGVRIRTPEGIEVPLGVVADAKIGPGSSTIYRTDGRRRITVSADVDTAVIFADEIIGDLKTGVFKTLKSRYPGINLVLKGEAGEMETSFATMFIGFILAILAIYMLIATLFRSYLQPLLILVTVPFGLIGAIWGHLLMGCDLTMISLFGMVGLAGIAVNDAIVLIERINANIGEGLSFADAVRLGGVRRFRAVFLTSVTTVGGLAPLMFETDPYATVLIPMAITIVFGVIFSTVLTLLLIPCLFMILNDLRLLGHRIKDGVWKKRCAVEPAQARQPTEPAPNRRLVPAARVSQ
ncbi:MAG: efflux RND transporter permease subunit [bacterium]